MAREALLWNWMHDCARGVKMLHMKRVENTLEKGTPDVDLCYWGHQAWVELKGCNAPARAASQLKYVLYPLQVSWLKKRWEVGGSSWLYFRVGVGRGVRRYLVPGFQAPALERCVPEGTLAGLSVLALGHDFGHFLGRVSHRSEWPALPPEGATVEPVAERADDWLE